MKQVKLSCLIVITLIFACACQSKKEEQSREIEEQSTEMHPSDPDDEMSMTGENDLITSYLKLKNALVKSDPILAQLAANELEVAFEDARLYSEAELAERIERDDDIEEQRKVFKVLSEQMYKLATNNKFEFSTLYKQYCPMAFDNAGAYWLSETKEIFNPYFGDEMLRCGKIEETLAKK